MLKTFDRADRLSTIMEDIFGLNEDDDSFHAHNSEQDATDESSLNNNSVKEGPKCGMLFTDIDTLFNFYQQHARMNGFSVAKRAGYKGKSDIRKYQLISCDRGRKAYD